MVGAVVGVVTLVRLAARDDPAAVHPAAGLGWAAGKKKNVRIPLLAIPSLTIIRRVGKSETQLTRTMMTPSQTGQNIKNQNKKIKPKHKNKYKYPSIHLLVMQCSRQVSAYWQVSRGKLQKHFPRCRQAALAGKQRAQREHIWTW